MTFRRVRLTKMRYCARRSREVITQVLLDVDNDDYTAHCGGRLQLNNLCSCAFGSRPTVIITRVYSDIGSIGLLLPFPFSFFFFFHIHNIIRIMFLVRRSYNGVVYFFFFSFFFSPYKSSVVVIFSPYLLYAS